MSAELIAGVPKDRLDAFAAREARRFAASRPVSAKAMAKGAGN